MLTASAGVPEHRLSVVDPKPTPDDAGGEAEVDPEAPGLPREHRKGEVMVWGLVDISHLSPAARFMVCLLGLLFFYIAYGLLQELVTTEFKRSNRRLGWFMTAVQFLTSVLVTALQRRSAKGSHSHTYKAEDPVPGRYYAAIGFLAVVSMGLSNVSCELLNYSTQVMFKSAKLIPVMIIGVVVLRKRYHPLTYCASAVISTGLATLALADQKASPSFEPLGVLLVCLSVFAGASLGNMQEFLFRKYHPPETEMMMYTKLWGCVFLTAITLATGQLTAGIEYAYERPWTVTHMMALAVTSVLGEYFGMMLTSLFGVLVAVTATSCRKALTLYLSLLLFPKPFTRLHLLGTVGIFVGIALNVYVQNQPETTRAADALRRWLRGRKDPPAMNGDNHAVL